MFGSASGDCGVAVRVPATPTVTTGPTTGVTQTSVTVTGTVNPNGLSTAWHFEYGLTSSYGTRIADQSVVGAIVNVASQLTGLDAGVTYHYRLVASNALGTAYGADQVFATEAPTSTQQADADRAIAVYAALQRYFYAGSVYQGDASSLFTEAYPQSGRTYSYLWPFSRVLVGTITLAGIPPSIDGDANFQPDVDDRLIGLARYWDGAANPQGYDSYPPAPFGAGGDKYYDDQAWIGLALAQNYRLTTNASSLSSAQDVFNFVYPTGLDPTPGSLPDPGGLFWVQQGVGVGLTNHDRTTTSNAPSAELGFRLEQLDPANAQNYNNGAMTMYGWVNQYLYNVPTSPTYPNAPNPNYDPSQPAIVFDKVTPGGIDKTHWTYNQGVMIAANVAAYRQTGLPAYLRNAEAIARAALDTFSESDYINTQPAAFNAIYFRGLLVLYAATSDSTLRANILNAAQAYADDAWNNYRNDQNLFRFPSSSATNYQLLDQGAMLQLYAALAWNPSDYDKLP
jgi:Glycosyl hydrolase family 76